MSGSWFHHPDLSVAVARRNAVDFLVDLILLYGEAGLSRGRSLMWSGCFPSNTAYYSALSRLKKAGVLDCGRTAQGQRYLRANVPSRDAAAMNPLQGWNSRWDGRWRILTYDITEEEHAFRAGLRAHLQKLRMGCLQQSVWITPRDIRPEYADLQKVLGIGDVSFLFEAHTVLGQSSREIVQKAWDFERIRADHHRYLDMVQAARKRLDGHPPPRSGLEAMAREEVWAYRAVMEKDPLLPRSLWPPDYTGFRAYEAHHAFVSRLRALLR